MATSQSAQSDSAAATDSTGCETLFVNEYTDGVLDPDRPMLGPVRDGGHIIANTAPGCWGPMITPAIRGGYQYYRRMIEVKNAAQFYVFVEEEHNGSAYGENEGGWHLPMSGGMNRLSNPGGWTFYDPLASYHNKSSTFGFADGHAERIKWMDKRTLEFIENNADDPSTHSGFNRTSPGNEDLRWLLEHFIGQERIL